MAHNPWTPVVPPNPSPGTDPSVGNPTNTQSVTNSSSVWAPQPSHPSTQYPGATNTTPTYSRPQPPGGPTAAPSGPALNNPVAYHPAPNNPVPHSPALDPGWGQVPAPTQPPGLGGFGAATTGPAPSSPTRTYPAGGQPPYPVVGPAETRVMATVPPTQVVAQPAPQAGWGSPALAPSYLPPGVQPSPAQAMAAPVWTPNPVSPGAPNWASGGGGTGYPPPPPGGHPGPGQLRPPVPSRKGPAIGVIAAVLALAILGIGTLVGVGLLTNANARSTPTATPPLTPRPTSPPPSSPSTTTPSTTASAEPTPDPNTDAPLIDGRPQTGYTGADGEDNRLYNLMWLRNGAASSCPSITAKKAPMSTTEVTRYAREIVGCLMAIYKPALADQGITIDSPKLITFSGPTSSPCGKLIDSRIAVYCTSNKAIYISTAANRDDEGLQMSNLVYLWVTAHEFTHFLQHETGILDGAARDDKQVSRRIELQANCGSGVFLGSIWDKVGSTSEYIALRSMFGYVYGNQAPGQGTHGTPESTAYWFDRGFRHEYAAWARCNTFVVGIDKIR